MPSAFQLGQLTLALIVVAIIAERVRLLHLDAATSDEAVRWILRTIEQGEQRLLASWAEASPCSHVGRVLQAGLGAEANNGELRETLLDLREEASARLRLLRVAATLASTVGLLGGILALAGGTERAGLSALKAGGAERATFAEAIATMAIGVATSALCFQAIASLRPAAQKLIAQAEQVARALGSSEGLR